MLSAAEMAVRILLAYPSRRDFTCFYDATVHTMLQRACHDNATDTQSRFTPCRGVLTTRSDCRYVRQLEGQHMQMYKKIMLRSFVKSICVAHSSAGTANQLYRHRKHQQPTRQVSEHKQSVIQAVQAEKQATVSTYSPKHKQVVVEV